MADNIFANIIPRGSLGLKLLLVCVLVLLMNIPLIMVGGVVNDRQTRATQVTTDIGGRAGGAQTVGGPMLLVPYAHPVEYLDAQGVSRQRIDRGNYLIFPETGTANAHLAVIDRHRGIYRAAVYTSTTDFHAHFKPQDAVRGIDPAITFDWTKARFLMFVSDSRAVRDAAELHFSSGGSATLEPASDLGPAPRNDGPQQITNTQAFAAQAPFTAAPESFDVDTRLVLGGAQRFALAAFAQDTAVSIAGDRRDASAEGYFQALQPPQFTQQGFSASWRVPFVARGVDRAIDLSNVDLGFTASRDMGVSFVAADDIYNGVMRAVKYAIMFIGIVFLATLIFEAVSGKKAHPAQYILVGLAQCVFYLLLLSFTELFGFDLSFFGAAAATVLLLSFYVGSTFRSVGVGFGALIGLTGLYGAMYVLMTLEDFGMLAGSVVAFVVIAATMIATRRINWYGGGRPAAAAPGG